MIDRGRQKTVAMALAAAIMLFLSERAAFASSIMFDFNSPTLSTSAPLTGVNSLQSYMNALLTGRGGGTVAVSGARLSSSSLIVTNSYNGENHVIYTNGVEWTLGTTDGMNAPHGGANDSFLYTFTGSSIIMQFSGISPITQVGFDYEIFPNADCPNVNTCGGSNVPDFTFKVNGTSMLHTLAPNVNGVSPASNPERNPQLGPQTFNYNFGAPTSAFTLEFDDWPATIGVDNLNLVQTPEPGTILLLGSGLAGVLARRRQVSASRSARRPK